MRVYRISSAKYIYDLTGEGARLFGGRWNRKGVPAIYTSQHQSLAALEVLANTPVSSIPPDLKSLILEIPDLDIKETDKTELPENWYDYPAPDILKEIGTDWLLSKDTFAMKVPSAIIYSEFNYIINPSHQNMEEVRIIDVIDFAFDGRLNSD